jgi:hypothetical protein
MLAEVDYTDEIGVQLREILQQYLPEELATIPDPLTPPPIETWYQGSVLVTMEPAVLPAVVISSEPPGGLTSRPMGLGLTPETRVGPSEDTYRFFIHYVLAYRGTEDAIRSSRKAAAAMARVLRRYALADDVVGWKNGWVVRTNSGMRGQEGTRFVYCIGTCEFVCERYTTR